MGKCLIKTFEQPQDYLVILKAMQVFTAARDENTADEIWLLEHEPVFTYGAHTKPTLPKVDIPVIPTDRGGNITYHAPGQIIIYPLIDIRRLGYDMHSLINRLENLATAFVESYKINTHTIPGRRGVYTKQGKIASLGLKFKRFCSYHGLAINIDLDLSAFKLIKPCGYQQNITSLSALSVQIDRNTAINKIIALIPKYLEITT